MRSMTCTWKRKVIAGVIALVVVTSGFLIPIAVLSGGSDTNHSSSDLNGSTLPDVAAQDPTAILALTDTVTSQPVNPNPPDFSDEADQGPAAIALPPADTSEKQLMEPMLLEDFESGWSLTRNSFGRFDYDPLIRHQGSSSLKITKFTGQANTEVEKYIDLNLVDKDPYIWVRIEEGVTHLYCYLLAPNWSNSYSCNLTLRNDVSLEDTWYRMPLHIASAAAVHNTPDLSHVAKLILQVHGVEDAPVSAWVDDMGCYTASTQGKVTLRFDDGDISTYETAMPILSQHGFAGVAGIVTSWIDHDQNGLSLKQLHQMQETGWDIVSHSKYHHLDHDSPADIVDEELKGSQEFLVQNGFDKGARFYIAPGGKVSATIMEKIKTYYSMASFSWPQINNADLDPYAVGGFYVAQDTPPEVVKAWIDKANKYGLWLVLMFHAIDESGEVYTYSTADFTEVIDYLDAVDIPVVTFSQVLDSE